MVGMQTKRRFEEAWPELADIVRRSLLRRRVPTFLADDIVQDTGLRLFRMWDDVDEARSPRGLALTIAGNLLWDETNRRKRHELLGEVPEDQYDDVERAGIARIELARVRRAMGKLNPHHRSVLLAEIGDDEVPFGSSASIKMMRMRARRRLTALLESASAGAFFPLFRKLAPKAARMGRRVAGVAEVPALALAMCTAAVMVLIPTQVPAAGADPSMSLDVDEISTSAMADTPRDAGSTVTSPASLEITRGTSRDTTRARGEEPGRHYRMVTPAGMPVQGGATIDLVPKHGRQPTVGIPSCGVTQPREGQVLVTCREQVNGQELKVEGGLKVAP